MGGVYIFIISSHTTGADPGFLLGGGAPLRMTSLTSEVNKFKSEYEEGFISGGGGERWVHTPCTHLLDLPLRNDMVNF